MNAERLHAIALAVDDELTQGKTPAQLAELATALERQAGDPAELSYQQTVSSLRDSLYEQLREAPSNVFAPAWRQALEEMGIAELLGDPLRLRIEGILARNDITPATAANELTAVAAELSELQGRTAELIRSLRLFHIGAEELAPGDFEIGVLIPRAAVHNDLDELGREFVKLNRAFEPLLELATGSRPNMEIRTISSSAFQAFLHSAPAMALLVAKTIESLVNSYVKVRNIRDANRTLKEQGVPDEALAKLIEHANERMMKDVEALADEMLVELRARDENRANELRKELVMSLNALANRIDQGYSIEVRAGELPPPPEEEDNAGEVAEDETTREAREAAEAISARQYELHFMNLTGSPILELDEGGIEERASDDPESGR